MTVCGAPRARSRHDPASRVTDITSPADAPDRCGAGDRPVAGGAAHIRPRMTVHRELAERARRGRRFRPDHAGDARPRSSRCFPRLQGAGRRSAGGTLSGGEQQMLAIARALDGAGPACCCSTSRPWASRRLVVAADLRARSATSTGATGPDRACSSSRTRFHALRLAHRGYVHGQRRRSPWQGDRQRSCWRGRKIWLKDGRFLR